MNDREKTILQLVHKSLLVRKDDLTTMLRNEGFSDGLVIANKLKEQGYLKFVDSVGSPCFTITQSGMRALKEM